MSRQHDFVSYTGADGQITSHGALVAFIRSSPLVGVDELDLDRSSDFSRNMEL